MYLEERVAHLEDITTYQGKQIEMVAEGLATLTISVDRGFEEMRIKFLEDDARFDRIDQRFEQIERRLDRLEEQVVQIHSVLMELVTLVKNKL